MAAIAAGVAIVLLAAGAAFLSMAVLAPPGGEGRSWANAILLLTLQSMIIALVLAAAGMRGARRRDVLSLGPLPSARQLIASVLLMAAIFVPFDLIVMQLARQDAVEDMKPFLGLMRSPAAPLFALVIAVGAPLSEELLFRGFLLSALSDSRFGFFGAALFTTVAWVALHAGYSGLGLGEVFLAGLYFSWLLWRTGNLWVPILCHALYNTASLALWLSGWAPG